MEEKQIFNYTMPIICNEIPLQKWTQFESLATIPDIDQIFLESKSHHIKQSKGIEIYEVLGL